MAARSSASWRARAPCIAAGCSSQRRVLPSMSVNRKVTVPVGRPAMGLLLSPPPGALGSAARLHRAAGDARAGRAVAGMVLDPPHRMVERRLDGGRRLTAARGVGGD